MTHVSYSLQAFYFMVECFGMFFTVNQLSSTAALWVREQVRRMRQAVNSLDEKGS